MKPTILPGTRQNNTTTSETFQRVINFAWNVDSKQHPTSKSRHRTKWHFAILVWLMALGILLSSTQIYGQAASATWNLTTNGNVSSTVGSVAATTQTFTGLTSSYSGTDGATASNWATSFNNAKYLQFTIKPTAGNNLTLSSLSFFHISHNSPMTARVSYSLDNFATAGIQIGSDITTSSSTSTQFISPALSIIVNDGTTLTIRIYGAASSTARQLCVKTFVLSGTTAPVAPTLSASTLAAFGAQCINTTVGPNSFTITGTNLTTESITVGPLDGYTYSDASNGTYLSSLSLSHAAGSYSPTIYVKFTPALVQSYNGNIPVGGGGASSINVTASGSGLDNAPPSVTSPTSSSITNNSATLGGNITFTGCSAVTERGIYWSTTDGFADGEGTKVSETGAGFLTGVFTISVSPLSENTVYYYKAFATNSGSAYSTQGTFTTSGPTITAGPLTGFGNVCTNTTAGPNSFTINGVYLTNADITVSALSGYEFSTSSNGVYTASLTLTQPGGSFNQTIYVRFTPVAVQSYNGNIVIGGGGASNINVAATGSGINTAPTISTPTSTAVTAISATLGGNITSLGCTPVTERGIYWSKSDGFARLPGNWNNVFKQPGPYSTGTFTIPVTGLNPSTVCYYKAFATNSGRDNLYLTGNIYYSLPDSRRSFRIWQWNGMYMLIMSII